MIQKKIILNDGREALDDDCIKKCKYQSFWAK